MKFIKNRGFSTSFLLLFSLGFSTILIAGAVIFLYLSDSGSRSLDGSLGEIKSAQFKRIFAPLARRASQEKSISGFALSLEAFLQSNKTVQGCNLFARTGDENYFRLILHRGTSPGKNNEVQRGSIIREEKPANYLWRGLTDTIVDRELYSDTDHTWMHVYMPVKGPGKSLVLQCAVTAEDRAIAREKFEASTRSGRTLFIITAVLLLLLIITGTFVFHNQFSFLIKKLSSAMNKVARGNLSVRLNETEDRDLKDLARSFNQMIEVIRQRQGEKQDRTFNSIFHHGVRALKANELTSAITIFRALSVIKPDSFGSRFNLGVALAKSKQFDESHEMFSAAAKIDPSHKMTRLYLEKVEKLRQKHAV